MHLTGRLKGARVLYDKHVPTNSAQKVMLAVGSAIMSLVDPRRHGMSCSVVGFGREND